MDTQEMNITYDLGGLAICDSSSVLFNNPAAPSPELHQMAQTSFMKLFRKYLSIKETLQKENEDQQDELQIHDFSKGEFEVRMPEKTTVVPRFRALPSEKILTKWQKYAKEKGIHKKKRSRMVFDETTQEMAPRWGAYSIKHNANKAQAIIEVKKGEDPNEDPYEKQGLERQLEKEKQNMKTLKNRAVAQGATSFKDSVPQEKVDKKSKKIVKTKSNRKAQLFKQKSETGKVLAAAQKSTASMGKHDKKAHKEETTQKVAKRKIVPTYGSSKQEKNKCSDILAQVMSKDGLKKVSKT